MKSLEQHINEYHGGNKAEFSRSIGSSPTVTQAWIKKGFYVTSEGYVINPETTKRDPVIEDSSNG